MVTPHLKAFLGRWLGWIVLLACVLALIWGWWAGFRVMGDSGCWMPEQRPVSVAYGPARGVGFWVICEIGAIPPVRNAE